MKGRLLAIAFILPVLLAIASVGCSCGSRGDWRSTGESAELTVRVQPLADCPFELVSAKVLLTEFDVVCTALVESRTRLAIEEIVLQCSLVDTAGGKRAPALPAIALSWEGVISSRETVEVQALGRHGQAQLVNRAPTLYAVLEPKAVRYSDGSQWVAGGPVELSR